MTENSRPASRAARCRFFVSSLSSKKSARIPFGILLISCLFFTYPPLAAKSKKDKFHGTVVAAGPKAITVKNRDNIYQVRTFNYSADLEKKVLRKKPQPGSTVTVHYIRGTDQAVKID